MVMAVGVNAAEVTQRGGSSIDLSSAAMADSESVPVKIEIDLPGCRYRRADERLEFKSNITLSGIDTQVRIQFADSTIDLSHHDLAVKDIKLSSSGDVFSKRTPDTTIHYELLLDLQDTVDIDIIIFAKPGRRFGGRDRLKPTTRRYQIPAIFNQGRPIQVDLRIDKKGEIFFRYW